MRAALCTAVLCATALGCLLVLLRSADRAVPASCSPSLEPALLTVVTGYWQLSRGSSKHSEREYAAWLGRALRVDAPYVIYTEDAAEDSALRSRLAAARAGLATQFVARPLEGVRLRWGGVFNASWTHPAHVPSAELALVWLDKAQAVADAVASGRAATPWVAWVDAGAALYRSAPPPCGRWPDPAALAALPLDRVVYTRTGADYHDFAGTAFAYAAPLAPAVAAAFADQVGRCAREDADWRCGSDQYVWTRLRERRPQLFFALGEGYGDLVRLLYPRPGGGPGPAAAAAADSR